MINGEDDDDDDDDDGDHDEEENDDFAIWKREVNLLLEASDIFHSLPALLSTFDEILRHRPQHI